MILRFIIFFIAFLQVFSVCSQNHIVYKNTRSYIEFTDDSILDFSMICVAGDTSFLRAGKGDFIMINDTIYLNSIGLADYEFKIFKEFQLYIIGEVKFFLEYYTSDSLIVHGPFYNNKKNIESVKSDYSFISKWSLKRLRFRDYFFYRKIPRWVQKIDENERRVLIRMEN